MVVFGTEHSIDCVSWIKAAAFGWPRQIFFVVSWTSPPLAHPAFSTPPVHVS